MHLGPNPGQQDPRETLLGSSWERSCLLIKKGRVAGNALFFPTVVMFPRDALICCICLGVGVVRNLADTSRSRTQEVMSPSH